MTEIDSMIFQVIKTGLGIVLYIAVAVWLVNILQSRITTLVQAPANWIPEVPVRTSIVIFSIVMLLELFNRKATPEAGLIVTSAGFPVMEAIVKE